MPSRSAPHRRVASSLLLAGLAALGALLGVLVMPLGAAREPEPSVGPALTGGLTMERDLRGGEAHRYPVEVAAGQFLRVIVQEDGIDVEVRLLDPRGAVVTGVDGLLSGHSDEDLAAILASPGTYHLEVRSPKAKAAPGKYGLRTEGPRPARDGDEIRAQAVKAAWDSLSETGGDAPALERRIAALERALPLWRRLQEPRREAEADFLLGLYRVSLPGGAEPAAQDYLASAALWSAEPGAPARIWQVNSLNSAGTLLKGLGHLEEAKRHYQEALAISRETGNLEGQAMALSNLALMTQDEGDVQAAIDGFSESLRLAKEAGKPDVQAKTLNNLGLAYFTQLAEPQKAIQYFEQSLELARAASNHESEGTALNNLGLSYFSLGDWEMSLKLFRQALAVPRSVGEPDNEAKMLINVGAALVRLGHYDEAGKIFLQALARCVDRKTRTSVLIRQAYLRVTLKQPAEAVDTAQAALQSANGFPDIEASALCVLGVAHREAGDLAAARLELTHALALAHERQDRSDEAEIGFSLAKTEREAGDFEAAVKQARSSVDTFDSLRTKVYDQRLRSSLLATQLDAYEVYIDVLMASRTPANDAAAQALQVSERARARSLLDVLNGSGAEVRAGADSGLVKQEHRLRDAVNSLDSYRFKLLSDEKPDRQKLADTEHRLEETLDQYRKSQAALRASSPGYAALTQPQPLSLAEIRSEVLDGRALLLEYALGAKRSFLWVVTPETVESFELPARERIEPVARRYYALVNARNEQPDGESPAARKRRIARADAEAERAGQALGRLILSPAAHLLGDRPLLIVADGALQYIPFAALPIPGSSAPLISRHEVVTLPSASALAALRREVRGRPRAPQTLAIFADPVFQATDQRLARRASGFDRPHLAVRRGASDGEPSPGGDPERLYFGRLPSSEREAQTIAALVPPGQLFLATGFAATRARALSPELARFRNLHFATHGVLDSRRPELSKLVLSLYDEHGRPQDGFLPLNDIYNLHLNADLVVLSACRTALGQDIRGEGLVGLTRGFMYAGAARVLASLWSVEDRATTELMGELYRGMLRQGLSPAAALRRAQLAMLKSPSRRAPFYWAGFSLQGEWR